MHSNGDRSKTWILVKDGKFVKNHKIDVIALAKILTDIQRAYDNIGHSKYGVDYKKEDFRLYIGNIETGSVALPVAPLADHSQNIASPDLFKNITTCFERLIDTLSSDPDEFKPVFEEEVTDFYDRLGVLKSMRSLSELDNTIHLKNSIDQPDEGVSLNKQDSQLISQLITEYAYTGTITISGLMLGFQGDQNYFTLKTDNGRNVRCSFDAKNAENYLLYFWKWVCVTGTAKITQKSYNITHVSTITEHSIETINKIGEYNLLKPIELRASYDKNDRLWCLENEELSLHGYGENYLKTITSLEEEIEGHILSFTEYPDEKHTKKSIELKKRLQEHIDFEETLNLINKKYGEQ